MSSSAWWLEKMTTFFIAVRRSPLLRLSCIFCHPCNLINYDNFEIIIFTSQPYTRIHAAGPHASSKASVRVREFLRTHAVLQDSVISRDRANKTNWHNLYERTDLKHSLRVCCTLFVFLALDRAWEVINRDNLFPRLILFTAYLIYYRLYFKRKHVFVEKEDKNKREKEVAQKKKS